MRSGVLTAAASHEWTRALLVVAAALVFGAVIVSVQPAHTAFLIAGLLATGLLALRPHWYVLAFWAFTLFGPSTFEKISETQLSLRGLPINPLGFLNGLLPIFYVSSLILRPVRPGRIPLRLPLLILAAWATVSLFIGGFSPRGVRQWVTLLNWISAYFLFIDTSRRSPNHANTIRFMIAVAALFAAGVLWGALTGQGTPDHSQQQAYGEDVIYRATGFGAEAEGAGEILAVFSVACLAFLVGPLRIRSASVLFPLMVLGVWCTHARTATFGLLVASLFVLWKARGLNWISGGIAIGAAVVATLTNPRLDLHEVLRGNINEIVYANAVWRMEAWKELVGGLSLRGYLHGNGIGSAWESLETSPHNEYVEYLNDFGLPGVGLLLVLLVSAFRYGAGVYDRERGKLTRTWGLALMGIVIADATFKIVGIPLNSPSTSYPFWLVVAMTYLTGSSAWKIKDAESSITGGNI